MMTLRLFRRDPRYPVASRQGKVGRSAPIRTPSPWALGLMASCVGACAQPGLNQTLPPANIALTISTPAFFEGEQESLFQVTAEVPLPMKQPTEEERAKLGELPPFPREPFHKDGDVEIEINYTLTNLDDATRTVELLIDPWNEFVRYRPLVVEDEEELIIDLSGHNRRILLQPRARVEGVVTPDDTREMAIDLGTAMAIANQPPAEEAALGGNALMNRAMNLQNRSSGDDPILRPYIPPVAAGLTGFDVGLRSAAAINVALEITVRLRTRDQKFLVEPGKDDPSFGVPGSVLSPPSAVPPAP